MFLFSGISRLIAPSMLLVATCRVLFWALAPFCCCCGRGMMRKSGGEFAFRLLAGCWVFVCFNAAAEALSCTAYDLLNLVQCPL